MPGLKSRERAAPPAVTAHKKPQLALISQGSSGVGLTCWNRGGRPWYLLGLLSCILVILRCTLKSTPEVALGDGRFQVSVSHLLRLVAVPSGITYLEAFYALGLTGLLYLYLVDISPHDLQDYSGHR